MMLRFHFGKARFFQCRFNCFRCMRFHAVNDLFIFDSRRVCSVGLVSDQKITAGLQDSGYLPEALFKSRPEVNCLKSSGKAI